MNFSAARIRAGLTRGEVAVRLGVDRSTVAYWESGRNIPRASMLVKLADLYCCSIDELMGRKQSGDSA